MSSRKERKTKYFLALPVIIVLILAIIVYLKFTEDKLEKIPALTPHVEGLEFDTVFLKDIEFYLDNNNPWNDEMEIEVLPVYELDRLTFKETKKHAEEIADKTHSEITYEEEKIFDDNFHEGYFELDNGIQITVSSEHMQVYMTDKFDYSDVPESDDKLEYTKSIYTSYYDFYQNLINYNNPIFYLSGYSKNYIEDDDSSYYSMKIYDKSDNIIDNIVNYNMNNVEIMSHENDILWYYLLGNKMGDYPIITLDQAKEKLLDGEYLTDGQSFSEDTIKEDEIAGVELTYLRGQPVYTFYIQLGPGRALKAIASLGLKAEDVKDLEAYLICYVPAIQDEFIH